VWKEVAFPQRALVAPAGNDCFVLATVLDGENLSTAAAVNLAHCPRQILGRHVDQDSGGEHEVKVAVGERQAEGVGVSGIDSSRPGDLPSIKTPFHLTSSTRLSDSQSIMGRKNGTIVRKSTWLRSVYCLPKSPDQNSNC
jgi:hypothetical protein